MMDSFPLEQMRETQKFLLVKLLQRDTSQARTNLIE
jgi:hypothetical protein